MKARILTLESKDLTDESSVAKLVEHVAFDLKFCAG
jgi:hypothetical protein